VLAIIVHPFLLMMASFTYSLSWKICRRTGIRSQIVAPNKVWDNLLQFSPHLGSAMQYADW